MDGRDPRTGRNGWASTVKNETGRTLAAAHGAPPDSVEDVTGTEAWAVKEAAKGALPGRELVVDCLPCVDAFKVGVECATSDGRKHARVHWQMLQAWGDVDSEQKVVGMPSHTTEVSVGVAELGDGTKLTVLGRRGNDQADTLAKKAALTHRAPEGIRLGLQQQKQLINETVRWIGLANYEANNYTEARTETPQSPEQQRTYPEKPGCRQQ